MYSSYDRKRKKAEHYAVERERRICFSEFKVTFKGENSQHEVRLIANRWHCDCDYFGYERVCSHTMALERVLGGMLPRDEAQAELPSAPKPVEANQGVLV